MSGSNGKLAKSPYFYFFNCHMRGLTCAILLLFIPFLNYSVSAQSYGLRFCSHEVEQEKRTSLNLSPSEALCFKNDAEISFDLVFAQRMEIYFGYVFRMITSDGQNIDLIYNQKFRNFNFIIGEAVSGTFTIDSAKLYNDWNHFSVRLNTGAHEVQVFVNGRFEGKSSAHIQPGVCLKLSFGTNSFEDFQTEDIPPMSIKDIRVLEGNELKYYWPLSETTGTECYDSVQHRVAKVTNPLWLKPQHQNWALAGALQVDGSPSVAFDAAKDELYVIAEDSLYILSLDKGQITGRRYGDGKELLPAGNQAIINPSDGKLFNFFIDEKRVRSWDTLTQRWEGGFIPGPMTEFWQAGKFFSKADTALYIIGGYGQLTYKNLVQRYDLREKKWEVLKPGGDYLTPRYLFSVGVNAAGDTAFILGGYGSTTGNQMANPKYLYDLVAYSIKSRSFKVLYHLREPDRPFCFGNSLILDPDGDHYYTLIYSNDKFNSALQLINGSLRSPGYQLMGDAIPYSFYDIKSFADLYYSPLSKQLVAVTLYTNKENRTDVKIYTIAFPPNAIAAMAPVPVRSFRVWFWILLIPAACVVVLSMYRRRKKAPAEALAVPIAAVAPAASVSSVRSAPMQPSVPDPVPPPVPEPAPPDDRSMIFFFGQFEAYSSGAQELTKQFTPLLKEMFLLIVIYTLRSGKGISSEKLYSILWKDKSNKDAQNNRSVNMVKLKGILDKLGTCGIVKEADKWVFHYAVDQIRIDLADFLALLHITQPNKQEIHQLLAIVHRGAFLADTAYPWLDDIQSEMSDKALDVLSAAAVRFSNDAEFLLEIAGGIFLFDPVNEEALKVKCKSLGLLGRHSMAKATFEKFAKEYYLMYGEEFQQTFHEVIN